MKKSDLKTGMIVETRNGWQSIIMLNTSRGDIHVSPKNWQNRAWGTNDIWNEDLLTNRDAFLPNQIGSSKLDYTIYDVVKVFGIKNELIWAVEKPREEQLIYKRE